MTGSISQLVLRVALLAVLMPVAPLDGSGLPAALAQGRAEIAIIDGAFLPESILVQAGDTVTWTNIGTVPHTVTADDGSFVARPLAPGASVNQSFPTSRLVTYHCAIHPQMIGAITITAAPDQGDTPNRLPTTGVGTAPGASLPPALLALLAAVGLGTRAVVARRR